MSENKNSDIWAEEEYHFAGQRPDEVVQLVRAQHWIVLTPAVLICIVSLVIPYIVLQFLAGKYIVFPLIGYTLAAVTYLGSRMYAFTNSVMILTNERILNVIQKGFFQRQIVEAELSRIQDVSSTHKGVAQTMFRYGDVIIRTASESILKLTNVPDPYQIQQAIVRSLKGREGKEGSRN